MRSRLARVLFKFPHAGLLTAHTSQHDRSVSLVNLDQLEALHALRASVSSEKTTLEAQVDQLRRALREAEEQARLQLEQVNRLLSDKVDLQGDGLAVRDRAIEREEELRWVATLFFHRCRLPCPSGVRES